MLAAGHIISSDASVRAVQHTEMFLRQKLPLMVHYYLHYFFILWCASSIINFLLPRKKAELFHTLNTEYVNNNNLQVI